VLVVVEQDPLCQVEGDLHVGLQLSEVLPAFAVALERHRFDLRRPAFTTGAAPFIDVLDGVVVLEDRTRLDLEHALDDCSRNLPGAPGLCRSRWFWRQGLEGREQIVERRGSLSGSCFHDRGCLGFHLDGGFEFCVGFLAGCPGVCHGTTREDDRGNNCSSQSAWSFHRVPTVMEGCSLGNRYVRFRH